MADDQRCDGITFFGATTEKCNRKATHYVKTDEHEWYWFCDRHYYYDIHGHYADDSEAKKTCKVCLGLSWRR